MYLKRFENGTPSALEVCKSQIRRGNMKARTSVLIIFVAALLVLARISQGYPAQTTPDQERAAQQNQSGNNPNLNNDGSGSENGQKANEAGSQCETPRLGNTGRPVVIRHAGWSWVLIGGLAGFLVGRITKFRRRPYGRGGDIDRNRAA